MDEKLKELIIEEFEEMICNAAENGFPDHSQGVRDALDRFLELTEQDLRQ